MGTNMKELQKELRLKDERIKKLQQELKEKDELIAQLKSQVDKYQAITQSPAAVVLGTARKERGVGISAEPSAQSQVDFSAKTFKKYEKSSRYVLFIIMLLVAVTVL